jgi:outer membrane protein assembly factor BamB
MKRRGLLAKAGLLGVTGISGCLRLQTTESETTENTSQDDEPTNTTPESTTTQQTEANDQTTTEALEGGKVVAYERDGTPKWVFDTGYPKSSRIKTIVGDGNTMAVASTGANVNAPRPFLFSLDPTTGEKRWEKEFDERPHVSIRNGNIVAVGTDQNIIAKYHPSTGERISQTETGTINVNEVILGDGTVYTADWQLRAFDMEDGSLQWSVADAAGYHLLGVHGDTVVTGTNSGDLFGLAKQDGAKQWEHRLDNSLRGSKATVHDETLWTVDSGGRVHAIDIDSGTMRYSGKPGGNSWESIAVTDGRLLLAAMPGSLRAYDRALENGEYSLQMAWVASSCRSIAPLKDAIYSVDVDSVSELSRDGSLRYQMDNLTGNLITASLFMGDTFYLGESPS